MDVNALLRVIDELLDGWNMDEGDLDDEMKPWRIVHKQIKRYFRSQDRALRGYSSQAN